MKKGIGKFLLASVVVLAIVVAADWTCGKVVDRMLPKISNHGQLGSTYFALNDVEYPILIVGSSRAKHHYIPSIMQDSLGMEAYNIARNGCFFSYNCCVILSVLDRSKPEMIVWETSMDALSDQHDPLESLYPYYENNKYVTKVVKEDCKWTERVPLISNFYKYNSDLIRILTRYLHRDAFVDDGLNGYIPIKPKEWIAEKKESQTNSDLEVVDEVKVQRFKDVLSEANSMGVRIVVVNSPSYMANGNVSKSEVVMREICDSMGVTILNFAKADGIYDDIRYWSDYIHMNNIGADKYTKLFLEKLVSK